MKQKILMLADADGCDDGIHSHRYEAGKTYDVTDSLAKNFIVMGVAETSCVEKMKEAHENKAMTEYENKAEKPNKRKGDKS